MNLSGQDWEPVVLKKKQPNAAQAQSSQAVNAARRSGAAVETVKKFDAGANKAKHSGPVSNAAKIEAETEELAVETVSFELKLQIQKARLAKKMTQAQLGQAINEKPQVIQDYESGKAIPNPQVLSKMSRILGVPLSNKQKKKK